MAKICSNLLHYLYCTYETPDKCLSCAYKLYGEKGLIDYLIKYVGGASDCVSNGGCPNPFCQETLGGAWVGSHHGGAKMQCGDCINRPKYRRELSDDGYRVLKYIMSGKTNISDEKKQELIAQREMHEEQLRKERDEAKARDEEYRIRMLNIKIDADIRAANEQREKKIERDRQKLAVYESNKKDFSKRFSDLLAKRDGIMSGIIQSKTDMVGYVIKSHTDGTNYWCSLDLVPGFKLRETIRLFCCFPIKYTNQTKLHKLFRKKIMSNLSSICRYESGPIYEIFTRDEFVKDHIGCIELLIYFNGRYGFINIADNWDDDDESPYYPRMSNFERKYKQY